MKFGCCTEAKNYQMLAACGYDYIELSGNEVYHMDTESWSRLVREIRGTGVPCIGFNDYCKQRPVIVGDGFDPAEAREYAQRLLDKGAELEIRNVGIGAPTARKLPSDYPKERADEQCMRFLEITAEEAAKRNMNVLFEAVHSHMCDYANRTEEALRMVRKVGAANLFMVLDFYHMEVMGEDLLKIEPYMPYVRHVHLSHCGKAYAREYLGTSDLPQLTGIFSKLRSLGYDGSASIESNTQNFAEDAARSLEILRQAAKAAE